MSFSERLDSIHTRLVPLRQALLGHPIYRSLDSLAALRLFMQHHVFAVWDFMSLLKALQQRLCCVVVPWLPPQHGMAARLVNEIVLGEESDDDGRGGYASHFDLYHRAMRGVGADTGSIDRAIAMLRGGAAVRDSLAESGAPPSVRRFVETTFRIINSDDLTAVAAAFTFGREDLLPDVFQQIIDELSLEANGGLDDFRFYLNRHIELDAGEHGPMAARLMISLCGEDEARWQIAEQAAVDSLQARLALWDGMLAAITAEQGAIDSAAC